MKTPKQLHELTGTFQSLAPASEIDVVLVPKSFMLKLKSERITPQGMAHMFAQEMHILANKSSLSKEQLNQAVETMYVECTIFDNIELLKDDQGASHV